MQITGTSITSVYSPKTTTESKEQSRLPAVVDSVPVVVETKEPTLLPAVKEASNSLAISSENDRHRSNFIRLFAKTPHLNQQNALEGNASHRPLPIGVQHYLQIESLNTEPEQRLFDAIV